MPRKNRLKSVAHSLAHYAVSGLAFIHPTLGKYVKSKGLDSVTLDLTASEIQNDTESTKNPILLSQSAMKKKLSGILDSEGFNLSDIVSAQITFFFSLPRWPKGAHVRLKTAEGASFESIVDDMGRPTQLLQFKKS